MTAFRQDNDHPPSVDRATPIDLDASYSALRSLAEVFFQQSLGSSGSLGTPPAEPIANANVSQPTIDARYRVLVEQIPAVVFMAFLDGGISEAYVSPQIERMLGFTQEEWLDDPIRWYQQIHPDDKQRWSVEAAQFMVSGGGLRSTYRVLARDGRTVWFRCEAKLVRKPDGQPWFIHGVGFDVTELKETELALQREIAERERLQKLELARQVEKTEQSEARLAAIVESSEDAIIGKTLDGTITSWNAAATDLFGYHAEEAVGQSILLIVPPVLHDQEMEILDSLRTGKRIRHQETQRLTKSGELVEVSLTISPIRNGAGQIIGASSIARDITERKRAEQALRESEERFRTMAETAADGIFRIDENSTVLFANRAAEQIFGYSREQLIGQNLTMLMPAYLRELHRSSVQRYVETGVRHLDWERVEVTGLHRDGREIDVELSIGESSAGGARLFTGFVRDVTERKRMEEKLRITEKLAATGRLAATISHEINNPLEAVTNFIYLAKGDPSIPEHVRGYLETADRELQRVSHIARQTLGFYRDTTSPVDIDVPHLLKEIIELYHRKITYKHLHVVTDFQDSCTHGLQGEIRQVFSNIIANAIEASSDNCTLTLRARRAVSHNVTGVRVTIADQGTGIPPSAREHIFQPFFSTKQNVGTGLGLWVSKSLVEKHGGTIRFRSSIVPSRKGTIFSVFLPNRQSMAAVESNARPQRMGMERVS